MGWCAMFLFLLMKTNKVNNPSLSPFLCVFGIINNAGLGWNNFTITTIIIIITTIIIIIIIIIIIGI